MNKHGPSGLTPPVVFNRAVMCDFDGTISREDVTDTLMEAYAHPDWLLAERRWMDGKIGSLQCMREQIALLDASRQQLDACLDGITIDPTFAPFSQWAQRHKIPLYVVSDGLDYAIERILHNHQITGLPVLANRLHQIGDRRWHITFPHASGYCLTASGTCKCRIARSLHPQQVVLIGDGRSDFCAAAAADHVMAKESLLAECQRGRLSHTPFENFDQVREYLIVQQANDAIAEVQ